MLVCRFLSGHYFLTNVISHRHRQSLFLGSSGMPPVCDLSPNKILLCLITLADNSGYDTIPEVISLYPPQTSH